MKLTTRIAINHLRSKHNFGFISFSNKLSILGLTIGIASLIIINSITHGFAEVVNCKLSNIDGHLRINSIISDKIDAKDISNIKSIINNIPSNVITCSSLYIEKYVIIRKGPKSEGILLYGVSEKALDSIFHLNKFSSSDLRFENSKSIIIGAKLSQHMNININDEIIVMNGSYIDNESIIKYETYNVSNIFQTDFPEYDRMLAFIPIESAMKYFDMHNHATGIIINLNNHVNINKINNMLKNNLNMFPYMTTTWKERHYSLLEWLSLYDLPIKIIVIFITMIGIFNIAASLWMIIIDKSKDFGILKALGLSNRNISQLILKEGAIIGATGSIFGIILSMLVIILQNTFNIITIPNDIYFMNHLPVSAKPIYFILYPAISFLLTLLFAYIPAIHASRRSPVESLRYE